MSEEPSQVPVIDATGDHGIDLIDTTGNGRSPSPKKLKTTRNGPYEVDILYENQRGMFFCGIPLYSHSSLLNFDPSPWVNKDLKNSAVNITNAQVPDPSWEWEWKTWYVDMSYDVDEQGWQYSFTFGNFAWHGTHPWFHSFVRRRRWLRKRVRKAIKVADAHTMTAEYFTIHSKRDQSPSQVSEKRASYHPEEIADIATLLKALRLGTIDREKIDAIKQFVEHGGYELAYLDEHIPEVMSFLVFQNSKRQVLTFLKKQASQARQHRAEHEAKQRPEGDDESRRIDNLLSAVKAADKEIDGLEYWSDRKHILKTADERTVANSDLEDNPVDEIHGIPTAAEVGGDPTHQAIHPDHENKGKGKAREEEH